MKVNFVALTKTKQSSRQSGFTLMETLAVVCIVMILITMLLPAVQQVRESARRTACKNNLVQLGTAVGHYESDFGCLPPGVTNPQGPIVNNETGQDVSFLVWLLPYLEQKALFNRFDIEQGAYAPINAAVADARLENFHCPSDLIKGSFSSYAGCHHHVEAPIDVTNQGLLFLNSKIRYREIADGRSNTILLGEKVYMGETNSWVAGTDSTLRNTDIRTSLGQGHIIRRQARTGVLATNLPPSFGTPAFVGGFHSRHYGGSNFGMADGAIVFVTDDIDSNYYSTLGHRADGAMMGSHDG